MKKSGIGILVLTGFLCGSMWGCGVTGKAELLTPVVQQQNSEGQQESEKQQETGHRETEETQHTGWQEETVTKDAQEVQKEMAALENQEGSVWNFSHRLLQENMQENNPVLSPVSAYLAMGMTGLGAAGDTLAEFQAVMGEQVHEIAERLIQELPQGTMPEGKASREETRDTVLSLANSVWVDGSLQPTDIWLERVSGVYGAEVYRAELSAKGTMKQMNGWIKHKTKGMIDSFLKEPLEPETCLALLNTVYFNGQWRSEFSANATGKDVFTTEDGTEHQVDMMRKNRTHLYYVEGETWDGALLPYRDGKTAFVALKPTAGQSVRDMYNMITEEDFQSMLAMENTTYANLKLPKFEVTFDKELNESLQNMGLTSAFDPAYADFSEIGTWELGNLYISLVRQKAVIRVDEKGTEAAAVTMVTQNATSAAPPKEQPIDVFFDRPFLYMIVDVELQVPVFMGIMDSPK